MHTGAVIKLKICVFIIFSSLQSAHSLITNLPSPSNPDLNQTQAIVTEILNNRFVEAEQLILKISNYSEQMPSIVKKVYNSSDKNINFVLKWAKGGNNIGVSFNILAALTTEMNTYRHLDPLMLMKVVTTIDSEVLNQKNGNSWKPKATILVNEIIPIIDIHTLRILKAAMLANKYRNNPQVQNLANELHHFRGNLSDSIMVRLVNQTFGRISSDQLSANIMEGSIKIPQIVMGLLVLFKKLESSNNMNDKGVLSVAKNIQTLKIMKNYQNLSQKKKIAVNGLIERLPMCAKNLFFRDHLCLWNRGKGEYLYASDAQYYFTRRSVFTCPLSYIGNNGIWFQELVDDLFYFMNQGHKKEYLYASTVDMFAKTGGRYVETWMDEGFVGETSAWNIELNGDYCYIRNENFKEYMFVSDEKHSDRRRYVLTAVDKGKPEANQNFQWQIRNCG